MKIAYFLLLSPIILTACNNETTLLSKYKAEKCIITDYALKYSDDTYEEECEGNRIENLHAFIINIDDDELKLTLDKYSDDYFYMENISNSSSFMEGSKVEINGSFDERGWTGVAFIDGSIRRAELTEMEKKYKEYEEINEKFKSNNRKIHASYLNCIRKIMNEKPGINCPIPSSGQGLGRLNTDGSIETDGICYFGKNVMSFECIDNGSSNLKITTTFH